jgi:hypothetical protein
MPKIQQINRNQNKVQNSQCFSKSVVLKELFKYLVEKSIKGDNPKELEIAYEVFGISENQTKEKNIRIYIHNLRKKLSEYYKKEGAEDDVIFTIPKGAYKVVFSQNRKIVAKSRMAKLSPYIFVFSLLILVLSSVIFTSRDRSKVTRNFMWADIYNSDFPVLMILGDHYFVNARNIFGTMTATRFTNINSEEEFDDLLESHPEAEGNFEITEQTYINKQGPFGLYKVMSFLGGGQVDIDFRYSSDLEWENLIGTNSIFIGSYKTQNILKQAFEKIGITYVVKNARLIYTTGDSTMVFNTKREDFLNVEHTTFIHFKTNDERTVMALMSTNDVGNFATIKFLSEPENLKNSTENTSVISAQKKPGISWRYHPAVVFYKARIISSGS